ncbi:MAG: DUF2628 domain-containing protein [Salaquimonas sp.]
MAIFEIYQNGNGSQVEFERDKTPIWALIVPAIWLFYHRLWYVLGVYLIISIAIASLANTQWSVVAGILSFIPGIYVFLEGQNFLASKLERAGLMLVDLVEADNLENAELKWFSRQTETMPLNRENSTELQSPPKTVWPKTNSKPDDNPEFGLFATD